MPFGLPWPWPWNPWSSFSSLIFVYCWFNSYLLELMTCLALLFISFICEPCFSFFLVSSMQTADCLFLYFLLKHFKGLSFPTISSVGPNASIIHYKPEAGTCAELDADSIYLFDSGAQVFSPYQIPAATISAFEHYCFSLFLLTFIVFWSIKMEQLT